MTFPTSVGHGNLPQGNAFPVIYSKQIQSFFKTASVVDAITNTDYTGEVSDYGDTVRILKEPLLQVQSVKRGTELDITDLDDEDLSMIIDQGIGYAFQVDDIEKRLSHIDWGSIGAGSGAYALSDNYDTNVLQYMHDEASTNASFGIGVNSTPVSVGYGGGNDFTPLDIIIRMARLMDENDVPMENRWFLASPAFYEQLGRESGKYIEADTMGDSDSLVRNKNLVGNRPIHGFTMYKSTNNPTSAAGDITIMAGHASSTATATAIVKSEVIRRERSFADLYRGLMVYGRKVLRPEALFTGFVTLGDA